MADILLDAFIDSLKILAVVAICTYIIAFIEPLLSDKIRLKGRLAPLIGVSVSLLPQCGFSVVATDLYQKRHITVGTLIGVFIATSDEALPIFLSYPDKALHILPILALKFAFGLFFGYLIDLILVKSKNAVRHHIEYCNEEYRIKLMHCDSAELATDLTKSSSIKKPENRCDCEECSSSECNLVHHHKQQNHENFGILYDYFLKHSKKQHKAQTISRFLVKPLLHSLEIFVYVLIINIIFGLIIYFVGEDKIISFLSTNKYIAPLFSVIIGIVPNCASSIILSELYIMGGLGFGATLGGLCMNAGLGLMMLFKDKNHIKRNFAILGAMFVISLIIAYAFSFIFNFDMLPIK